MSTSDDYLGKSVIEDLKWDVDPREVARSCFQWFEGSNRQYYDMAFRALHLIAEDTIVREGKNGEDWVGISPMASVSVPWWVVLVLSKKWEVYVAANGEKTLGEAFELDGTGRGNRSAISLRQTEKQNYLLAAEVALKEVALKIETGKARCVGQAIEIVAKENHKGEEKVRAAWKKYSKKMRAVIKNRMG